MKNSHDVERWCLIVPVSLRSQLLRMYTVVYLLDIWLRNVSKMCWWQGMRGDVRKQCRACLTCASRKCTSTATHLPSHPIPVGQTYDGNKYVAYFRSESRNNCLTTESVICCHGAGIISFPCISSQCSRIHASMDKILVSQRKKASCSCPSTPYMVNLDD